MSDKLRKKKSAKHVPFRLQFNKVIGKTEVVLENSEFSHVKHLLRHDVEADCLESL